MNDPIKTREIERQRLANERRCRLLGIPNAQELWESWDRLAAEPARRYDNIARKGSG